MALWEGRTACGQTRVKTLPSRNIVCGSNIPYKTKSTKRVRKIYVPSGLHLKESRNLTINLRGFSYRIPWHGDLPFKANSIPRIYILNSDLPSQLSHSSFSQTHRIANIGIIANFAFPYLDSMRLLNVYFDIGGYI